MFIFSFLCVYLYSDPSEAQLHLHQISVTAHVPNQNHVYALVHTDTIPYHDLQQWGVLPTSIESSETLFHYLELHFFNTLTNIKILKCFQNQFRDTSISIYDRTVFHHHLCLHLPELRTRDASLSHDSSTPWPSLVALNLLGLPLIIPHPTDSWNASTGPWRPPSCAMQTNIGLRRFLWFFSASAPHSKRICMHHQLSSCTEKHWESPASSWHKPHTRLNQRTSSHNCVNIWLASDQFQRRDTPVLEHSYTKTSVPAHMFSSVRTPRASLWSLLIAAPTASYLEQRKRFDYLFETNTSQCQPTG
jgi:hypothetical protein